MGGAGKVYPDRATAEARFRLQPPQSCANEFILQYIARQSIMPVEGGGYAWKFDDDLLTSLTGFGDVAAEFRQLTVPLKLMVGADSALYSARSVAYMQSLVPAALQPVPTVTLEEAQHHLFLDQPQAFIRELRTLLAA